MSKHWSPGDSRHRRYRQGRSKGRRRIAALWPLVLVGMALVAAYRSAPPALPSLAGAGLTASPALVSVTDGDTFDYDGETIRIADIDTPEVAGQCDSERDLAEAATDRLQELLDQGDFELRATGTRDEDRYGRKLRIVTRDGQSLGEQLVEEGLARPWTGRRLPWCGQDG